MIGRQLAGDPECTGCVFSQVQDGMWSERNVKPFHPAHTGPVIAGTSPSKALKGGYCVYRARQIPQQPRPYREIVCKLGPSTSTIIFQRKCKVLISQIASLVFPEYLTQMANWWALPQCLSLCPFDFPFVYLKMSWIIFLRRGFLCQNQQDQVTISQAKDRMTGSNR